MPIHADRALGALRLLLRSTHFAGADDLPVLVSGAGAQLGALEVQLYLVDYDQVLLVPLTAAGDPPGAVAREPVAIEGTLAGRAFTALVQHISGAGAGCTLWTPVLDGTERLGVLQLEFPADVQIDEELRAACLDVAGLVAELVVTKSMYGDGIERARRRTPMTIPAELQWRLLPPLTFISPRVAVAGALAPTAEVAGDSFDYALNGARMHVTVIDAMGHGLEATLCRGSRSPRCATPGAAAWSWPGPWPSSMPRSPHSSGRTCSSPASSGGDRPCKYSSGSTSATRGDFRDHAGRIAEENRLRSPVASSTRLSLTRGARTGIAPAAVVTSRAAWWPLRTTRRRPCSST